MNQQPLPDKRLNAYREDLADKALEGQVSSRCFTEGKEARVVAHFADAYDQPADNAGLQTQFLHGHEVRIFDEANGWAWVQCQTDGYVGYVRSTLLGELDPIASSKPTHMVAAPRTFLYSDTDLKSPRSGYRSIGSKVKVVDRATTRGTDYAVLDDGNAVIAKHLIDIGDWLPDPVGVAETLLHSPYLWGGNTGFGLDCSGLVWLANLLCGNTVLRDSDMQAASIGEIIPLDTNALHRGDLIFWKGHVGMMADSQTLLHANGNTMNVALEPLADAIERIGYLYDTPTLARRP